MVSALAPTCFPQRWQTPGAQRRFHHTDARSARALARSRRMVTSSTSTKKPVSGTLATYGPPATGINGPSMERRPPGALATRCSLLPRPSHHRTDVDVVEIERCKRAIGAPKDDVRHLCHEQRVVARCVPGDHAALQARHRVPQVREPRR